MSGYQVKSLPVHVQLVIGAAAARFVQFGILEDLCPEVFVLLVRASIDSGRWGVGCRSEYFRRGSSCIV